MLLAQDTGTRAAYCVHILSAEPRSARNQPAIPIFNRHAAHVLVCPRKQWQAGPRRTDVVMHHGSGDRLQLEKAFVRPRDDLSGSTTRGRVVCIGAPRGCWNLEGQAFGLRDAGLRRVAQGRISLRTRQVNGIDVMLAYTASSKMCFYR